MPPTGQSIAKPCLGPRTERAHRGEARTEAEWGGSRRGTGLSLRSCEALSAQKTEKGLWGPLHLPRPGLYGRQAGRQLGLRERMFKVSTCGGFHLSPAATTAAAAAAAGSDPPPCWPLTCCRQEGDVVTDSHVDVITQDPLSSKLSKG